MIGRADGGWRGGQAESRRGREWGGGRWRKKEETARERVRKDLEEGRGREKNGGKIRKRGERAKGRGLRKRERVCEGAREKARGRGLRHWFRQFLCGVSLRNALQRYFLRYRCVPQTYHGLQSCSMYGSRPAALSTHTAAVPAPHAHLSALCPRTVPSEPTPPADLGIGGTSFDNRRSGPRFDGYNKISRRASTP